MRIVIVTEEEIIPDTLIEDMNQAATMIAVETDTLLQEIMIEDHQKGVGMTHDMAMIAEIMEVMILIQEWMIDMMVGVVMLTEEIHIPVILALVLAPGPEIVLDPDLVHHPLV